MLNSPLEEYAVDCIVSKQVSPARTIYLIAVKFPKATVTEVIFTLVCLAETLQTWRANTKAESELPNQIYKACSLLGADMHALEKLGHSPAICSKLSVFWGEEEQFFK